MKELDQHSDHNGGFGRGAYILAVACFALGLLIGYFTRGLHTPKVVGGSNAASSVVPVPQDESQRPHPTMDQMRVMAEKAAAPLNEELKKKPNDPALLSKMAQTYFSAHQFDQAISYAQKATAADPKNVGNRADLASYQFYADRLDDAIATLEEARRSDPKNPQVLWNLGVFHKAKNDRAGAVALWKELLRVNPELATTQKQQVERAIADVSGQQLPVE